MPSQNSILCHLDQYFDQDEPDSIISLDTLYLGWPFNGDNKVERFVDLWNKHDFSHLRYLAVHEEVFGVDFVFGKDQAMAKRVLGAALERLCGLKELIYVCDVMEHGESKISVPFNEKGPMLLFKNCELP
jgi:hypothetical protein